MSWITENLNAGPWDFTKQPEKCGYVNNPRWAATPASEVIHEPCGYWPVSTLVTANSNLYGLLGAGNNDIWGARYTPGGRLEWIGAYQSSNPLAGLTLYNSNLLTLVGTGASASLAELTSSLVLSQNHSPFLANDVVETSSTAILPLESSDYCFVLSGWGGDVRLIRLNFALQRQKRFFPATVVEGTDGHLYVLKGATSSWNAIFRPITGGSWSSAYEQISDDICDSPITAWGVGTAYPSYTAGTQLLYGAGLLVSVMSQSVAYNPIRKMLPATGEIVGAGGGTNIWASLLYGDYIYTLRGIGDATVTIYDINSFATVTSSSVLPTGRAPGGSLMVKNGELVVLAPKGTGDSALYRLNLNSLAVISSTTIPEAWGSPQGLHADGDGYIVMGENDGVGIIQHPSLTVPTETSVGFEEASPPYLLFSAHVDVGYSTAAILMDANDAATVESTYCGTTPVWPMAP